MSSTYRSAKRDQRVADDFLYTQAACRFCGRMAEHADLVTYGARCRACYDAYLAEANPSWWPGRPLTTAERAGLIRKVREGMARIGRQQQDPRAWAKRLREREQAGERLSGVKRDAWRAALHAHSTLDAARDGAPIEREAIDLALQVTGDLPWPERDDVPLFDADEPTPAELAEGEA